MIEIDDSLRAAAPELLAVCQDQEALLDHREHCEVCGPEDGDYCIFACHYYGDLGERRRAAIAKAIGRPPTR